MEESKYISSDERSSGSRSTGDGQEIPNAKLPYAKVDRALPNEISEGLLLQRLDLLSSSSESSDDGPDSPTQEVNLIQVRNVEVLSIGTTVNITDNIVVNLDPEAREHNLGKSFKNWFQMVNRKEWLAQPSTVDSREGPARFVVICHTATEESSLQSDNVLAIRLLQTYDIESQGWPDLVYNFCIGSDGNIYEGRGWSKVGNHTPSYDAQSIGIAFIGLFLDHLPPNVALMRCKELIAHGVKIGQIIPDYELLAQCQCANTSSPGRKLFEEIQTWRQWNGSVCYTQKAK